MANLQSRFYLRKKETNLDMNADAKKTRYDKLNLDEKLSTFMTYNLVAKVNEIQHSKDELLKIQK